MERVKKCVGCRYCRMRWTVKSAGVIVAGAVATITGAVTLPI